MKKVLKVTLTLILAFGLISCGKKNVGQTSAEKITDDQALAAIKVYCNESIPSIEDMSKSEDYTIYWNVESSDDNQIVVLFRSYTGSEERYYIDRTTGDTYETVVVPGIIDEEHKTENSFNIKEYIK